MIIKYLINTIQTFNKQNVQQFILYSTVRIIVESDGNTPYVSGTALNNEKYLFEQLHFHWGHHKIRGTGHAIDGKSYAMEV